MCCSILHVADANWPLAYRFGYKALRAVRYADISIPPAQHIPHKDGIMAPH